MGQVTERSGEKPGERLKRAREHWNLTYRDVVTASQQIASRHGNDEFAIALSRLADIENKGIIPTIYRLYTLSAIYRLELEETLRWYGVPVELLAAESLRTPLSVTHATQPQTTRMFTIPQPPTCEIDLNSTSFLSHVIRRWGKAGLSFLNGWDLRAHRFGFIGLDDWSMHPVLHPGSVVLIDESQRRIMANGWTSELDRPIYFLEHRSGVLCGWCSVVGSQVVVQPHPSSQQSPSLFEISEIDVIGQVTGVAMLLEPRKPRGARSATTPTTSQDR
jgi:transcriptional regulator with XRE-family HTH domain